MRINVRQWPGLLWLGLAVASAHAVTVRGQLNKMTRTGLAPAGNIQVTLRADARTVDTALSGSDGLYYLHDVPPGTCTIQVWLVEVGEQEQVLEYGVDVVQPRRKYFDVRPILVNRLEFGAPSYSCAGDERLALEGSHSLPTGAPVALVFRDAAGALSRVRPDLDLETGRYWQMLSVPAPAGTREVMAVLFVGEPCHPARTVLDRRQAVQQVPNQAYRQWTPEQEPARASAQAYGSSEVLEALPADAIVLAMRTVEVRE
jgi:hypothetical protein